MNDSWDMLALKTRSLFAAPAWQTEAAYEGDVAISTRVRIARNIGLLPYPHKANDIQRRKVSQALLNSIKATVKGPLTSLSMGAVTAAERDYLVGLRLISPLLAERKKHSWAVFDSNRLLSFMINEEDHLRAQGLTAGMNLERINASLLPVVDQLEEIIGFARHPKYSYLTASPSNIGTGMRYSVMMHLIGLAGSGEIPQVLSAVRDMGCAIRGLFGEGSRAVGGYFQVSIIPQSADNLNDDNARFIGACRYLINRERDIRQGKKRKELLTRAEEAIKSAKKAPRLNFHDSLTILSWIRWAGVEQMIRINPQTVDGWSALMEIQSNSEIESEIRRAKFLKQSLIGA